MLEIESPAAPAAAQEAVEADGRPVGRDPRDGGGSPRSGARAARRRRQAGHRVDPRGRRRGRDDAAQAVRRRHRRASATGRKAEIARIREETDGRIATRKAPLEAELDGARGVGRTTGSKRSSSRSTASGRHGGVLRAPGAARRTRPSSRRWSRRCPTCRRSRPGPTRPARRHRAGVRPWRDEADEAEALRRPSRSRPPPRR